MVRFPFQLRFDNMHNCEQRAHDVYRGYDNPQHRFERNDDRDAGSYSRENNVRIGFQGKVHRNVPKDDGQS